MSATHDWQPTDLALVLDGLRTGTIVGPVPTLMPRSDGVALLYPGEVHSLAGEPEVGKGWLVQAETARLVRDNAVLYADFEDTAASVLGRLLALGATADQILANLVYVRPDTRPAAGTIPALLEHGPFTLAVIDGLSEAYVLLGLDPYSNVDAAKFLAAIARPIADQGAAVVQIDHVTKAAETRGRYAIGAQHKLAGIAAAYTVEAIKPPNRLAAGLLKITVTKDRHGHVRGHADGNVIALAHVTPTDAGEHVAVTLEPPETTGTAGAFRPTVLMKRVSQYLDANPGATTRAIRGDVKGKHDYTDQALRALIADGYVQSVAEGQARRHYNLAAYPSEADSAPRAPTVPQVSPGHGDSDRAPVPLPLQEGTARGTPHTTAPTANRVLDAEHLEAVATHNGDLAE